MYDLNLIYLPLRLYYIFNDIAPHYLCCDGKYFSGCSSRYYDHRPNDNCEDYPQRPPPGT